MHFATLRRAYPANYNRSLAKRAKKPIVSPRKGWHCACDGLLAQESVFRSDQMADVIFVIVTVVFFIIAWLYVRGCDRL